LVRRQAGRPAERSLEELQTYLERNGWSDAWYALTYRGHQANGGFADTAQMRRLSEAADHLDEFHAVMAAAAGTPLRFEGPDFSHARIEIIPDTLRGLHPREAITRLMAEPVLGNKSSPTGGPDSLQKSE
jgi:hypothetical protein